MLGRLKKRTGVNADASDAPEYTMTYSGPFLTSVGHGGDLFGNQALAYAYDDLNRPLRETYPNGRAIEFFYDTASRLKAVKDPFGFINEVGYDAKGRMASLAHMTLGTAAFGYDASERLESVDARQRGEDRIRLDWAADLL